MDILNSFVSNRKRTLQETKDKISPGKKYFRRGEFEQMREQEYLISQKEKESKKKKKFEKSIENIHHSKDSSDDDDDLEKNNNLLDNDQVVERLKQRGEPVTLFGEGPEDRLVRLVRLEDRRPVDYGMEGSDFLDAMKKMSETYEEDKMVKLWKLKQAEDVDFKKEEREPEGKEEEILFFLREQIENMRLEIEAQPDDIKQSRNGMKSIVTFQQTRDNIKPFFKDLRNACVHDDVLNDVYDIVVSLKSHQFVKANDAYYRMSIGNSPWPMGVANVDIHPRTARDRIATSQTAHALNDEKQRKYIHSIKRIMTHFQVAHPTVPSMSVM